MEKSEKSKVSTSREEKKNQEIVVPTENENNGAEIKEVVENEENVENTENENTEESIKTVEKDTYISVRKRRWVDLQDNNYPYEQGDIYPREGLEVSEERIKELSTINNKLGEILIQKVEKE